MRIISLVAETSNNGVSNSITSLVNTTGDCTVVIISCTRSMGVFTSTGQNARPDLTQAKK